MVLRVYFISLSLLSALSFTHADKPNIVLVLADDVSADMFSCYGQKGSARTPNIDRIAKEGVQFKTCFAPAYSIPLSE